MSTEKPRYSVTVDEELLQKIDDFRFENRYASRSAATLELIRLGMKQLEKEQQEAKCIDMEKEELATVRLVSRGGSIPATANSDELIEAAKKDALTNDNEDTDLF